MPHCTRLAVWYESVTGRLIPNQSNINMYWNTELQFVLSFSKKNWRKITHLQIQNVEYARILPKSAPILTWWHLVCYRLENLEEELITKKVKLVILDSVASLVRKEFDSRGTRNIVDRTNLLAKEASILKYIAEEFQIPVSSSCSYKILMRR